MLTEKNGVRPPETIESRSISNDIRLKKELRILFEYQKHQIRESDSSLDAGLKTLMKLALSQGLHITFLPEETNVTQLLVHFFGDICGYSMSCDGLTPPISLIYKSRLGNGISMEALFNES